MIDRRSAWLARASAACAITLAACSGGGITGGGNPFGGASETDVTFVSAANTWDLNKDNVVTCDEWKAYVTQLLRESDGNGDSALTADEFQKVAKTDRLFDVAGFKYFDQNGDGKITLEEFSGKPNPAFRLLDKNNDCKIESGEFVQRRAIEKKDVSVPTEMPRGGPGAQR
jgi:hypothetical protein